VLSGGGVKRGKAGHITLRWAELSAA